MSVIQMQRITILVLKRDAHRCTQALLASRLFQSIEEPQSENLEVSVQSLEQPDLVSVYTKLGQDLEALLNRFGVSLSQETFGVSDPAQDFVVIQQAVQELTSLLVNYDREHGRLQDQLLHKKRALIAQQSLKAKELSPEVLGHSERWLIRLGWVPKNVLSQLRETMGTLTYISDTLASLEQQELLLAIALPRDEARVDGVLLGVGFQPQTYRERSILDQSIKVKIHELHTHINRLTEEYHTIRRQWTERLVEYLQRVRMTLLILDSEKVGRATGPAVQFHGWVPVPELKNLQEHIQRATEGRCWIKVEPVEVVHSAGSVGEPVPILHRNPLLLQPFQRLVGAYGDPTYAEFDPTPVFALTFIVMFGMMFGDAGQGALLAAVGYGIFRRMADRQDIGILLMECGVSAMIFGVLYGNVFGIEHTVIPHLWFHPMENIPYFLKVTLIFGMVLLSVGFVINMINAVRRGAYAEAIFGKNGLAAAFLYWIFAGLAIRYFLLESAGAIVSPWVMGIVAALMLLLLVHEPVIRWLGGQRPIFPRPIFSNLVESAIEVVDTVARYAGNTVSFLRVAAFALVHAGLFLAIFTIANMLAQATGGTVLYWLTVAFGNVVVIVVEGLIVSIQILRLEYYEFFSKFYKGTGRKFRPMGT
jgi:V/A-type H+/Na+-transporting ATPase subunit I